MHNKYTKYLTRNHLNVWLKFNMHIRTFPIFPPFYNIFIFILSLSMRNDSLVQTLHWKAPFNIAQACEVKSIVVD